VRTPAFLQNIPRLALVGIVPVGIFLVVAAVVFSAGGDDDDDDGEQAQAQPTATRAATQTATAAPTAAATPEPEPEPTAPPNRESCAEIRGTNYLSDSERDWFNANCTGNAAGGGGGGSRVPSGGSSSSAGRGPSVPAGTEYALGDRLVIPRAGVNAAVSGIRVGSNGVMPDPVGYFNAVWYDFSALGLGGYVTGGNLVVAGHVDCARCNGGGPGTAVFYNTRYLSAGDTIQYITASGTVKNYVVFSNVDYSANTDFAAIVSPGAADITIITCTGSFSGGHYNLRNVVFGRAI
jgi:hypothetical protein